MRVSSYQLLDASIDAIQKQSAEAMKWQQQLSTGRKYSKASDASVEVTRGVEIAFDRSHYEMLKTNQDFVASRMTLADAQLGGMHSALAEMLDIGTQARNTAISRVGLEALAKQARLIYTQLEQQATAVDSNDEPYVIDVTTSPKLSQPQITVEDSGGSASITTNTSVIDSSAVFYYNGAYSITFNDADGDGSIAGKEVRLQIEGNGPSESASSYYVGTVSITAGGAVLSFPQYKGEFEDLRITLGGRPSVTTTLSFEANPIVPILDSESKIHTPGEYAVSLTITGGLVSAATLELGGSNVTTLSVVASDYNSSTGITTLNFGDDPATNDRFKDLKLRLSGDPALLSSGDRITFTQFAQPKQIEIEPGTYVAEGISFREALGKNTTDTVDVLARALEFVESLESSATAASLTTNFGARINGLQTAADQVLQYQLRAGAIGNRVDAAKAALEIKATELEAHRSRLLDTDIAEASAGLVRTQTLLEAARSIFARLESSNLFQ
ncbi:MAG: hypothetical protein EB101_09910, partial [Chitinophagia bacterium]|nr:hypothetical protein [Chitinophagia bacterium]